MKQLAIIRSEDGMFLAGFMMDKDTQPKAIWSDEAVLSWNESEFAMLCMICVGINTTECDVDYCEVIDFEQVNPENN